MDIHGTSHATLDNTVPSQQPFLLLVHEICDRVLGGAQKAGNIAAMEEIVDQCAACTDPHDSTLKPRPQ